MITIKILICIMAIIMLGLVIELIRRERLTFKYAIGWIFVLILAIVLAIFEKLLFNISRWLGFQVTSNFIFLTMLGVFVFLCLLMTIFLCQQDNRNRFMAQKIGMLELELRELRKKIKQEGQNSHNE